MTVPHPHRRGFTLVEMLIVVGIVALLSGLVLVMLNKSRAKADVIRVQSDLATIGTGLESYKADFGDYPRFADPLADQAAVKAGTAGNGTWLDYTQDRGARLLCRAMIGPGPAGTLAVANPGDDGSDGPGFRLHRNLSTETKQMSGRTFGPYLQADRWKLVYDPNPPSNGAVTPSVMYNAKILDIFGHPILYYVATPGAINRVTLSAGFVSNTDPSTYTAPTGTFDPNYPLYNSYDNYWDVTAPLGSVNQPKLLLDYQAMGYILGDRTGNGGIAIPNGKIDSGEHAVTVQPYLLWSAGPDGLYGFGPDPSNPSYGIPTAKFPGLKTDDICNFDIPPDLRK